MLESINRESAATAPTALILDNMIAELGLLGIPGLYTQRQVLEEATAFLVAMRLPPSANSISILITNDQLVAIAAKKSNPSRRRSLCTLPADSSRVMTALYEIIHSEILVQYDWCARAGANDGETV